MENKKIIIEGILAYDKKIKRGIDEFSYGLMNLEKESNLFNNSILIDNPEKYFKKGSIHPYQKLIASLIKETEDYPHILKIILENTQGRLIWLKNQYWLTITKKTETGKKRINNILKNENFLNSKLELENKNLEVWSKLTTNNKEKYEIKDNIEVIIEDNEDSYLWGQNLSSILNFDNKIYLPKKVDTDYKETENNDFDDLIKINLGEEKTKILLNKFYPYILLRAILGNQIDFPQNIDISLSIPTINYPNFIKYKVKLKTS
tara:strand:- start:370 stop:1155 length:786 start_codon:yes stop_codon:yes gene_type:complete